MRFRVVSYISSINTLFRVNVALFFFSKKVQAITSSGIKKGDLVIADVNTQLKNKNITTDIKVDTNSNVSSSYRFSCTFFLISCGSIFAMSLPCDWTCLT